jgi:hypothetical protein
MIVGFSYTCLDRTEACGIRPGGMPSPPGPSRTMTYPPAPRPLETDSEPFEPSATVPFSPPTRRFPGVIRSWRPNLTETTRKARARSSRVRPDLRRPGALSRAHAGLLVRCAGWCRWVAGLFRRSETGCFPSKTSWRRIGPGPSGAPLCGGYGTSGSRTIDSESDIDQGPDDEPLATMCRCASGGRRAPLNRRSLPSVGLCPVLIPRPR